MLKPKQKAPNFSLQDQSGKTHQLSDYLGRWILLYFYPKDDTPGCTIEACTLRDSMSAFPKGLIILGVSTDSVKSHDKFAKKYKLPFILLADEEKKLVKKYGVWGKKKFMGRSYMGTKRMSFLINPKGKIMKIYIDVKPATHANEVLRDLASLKE